MEPLVLPRQLVQEIFHQAQVAPGGGTLGLMVRREDGKLELAGIPLDADINGLMVGLAVHKWTPVAVYRSSMTATEESPAEQLAAWRGLAPLLLSVSLGTTGVLQLRGWGSQEGELQAVDVSIGDEPSPG